MNNDSHTTQLIIVCESLSSCNLKCEIGHIIPVSSAGNQTLLRTGLCRTQVPFLPLGVNFERPFSHLSHFIILKNHKISACLEQSPDRLVPFLSHQNQPKPHQQGVLLPELMQNQAQGNFWEEFLLEVELMG